jgi:3-hydroxyacyl-CoA dehydrogenase (EC 1.1.1.35)
MRWGFAHEQGPFQLWQAMGIAETANRMRAFGESLPAWVDQLIAAEGKFYGEVNGTPAAYNVATGKLEPIARDPRAIDLAALKAAGREVHGNESASVIDLGDGVLCFELHSKANTIGGQVIEMLIKALDELEQGPWVGMVVGNQGPRFSAGLDLNDVGAAVMTGAWDDIDEYAALVQQTFRRMRDSAKPIVSAPFGQTLGGGVELAMHSSASVAAAETYMGFVEFGVGVIPAWGGCTEMNRRFIAAAVRNGGDPLKAFQHVFETIALAKVATSAHEAKELGLLRPTDRIVFNPDYLIGEAKREVLRLVAEGYTPAITAKPCYALGRDGLAAARIAIYQMREGGFATPIRCGYRRKACLCVVRRGTNKSTVG